MVRELLRRDVLATAAVGGGTLLAGCFGDDEGDGEPGGDDGQPDDDGDPAGGSDDTPGGSDTDTSDDADGGDAEGGVELDLEVHRREQHNSVWERFDQLEVSLGSITLHAGDGSTREIGVDADYDLIEGTFDDGVAVAEDVMIPSGSYDEAEIEMPVADSSLGDGESDLPLEGFDPATVELEVMDPFEPESGDAWTLQFFLVLAENFNGDAYVLEPAVGWIRN